MIAFLHLIRWPNLLIAAITQVLIRQCILIPLLKQTNMVPQLSLFMFVLLIMATVCITAGGYVINDYFDRKIDRINKPESIIVGALIHPRKAMTYHLYLTTIGVVLGTWVAVRSGELYLCLIFFIVSGLLWFYSTTYKRQFLLGNFLVALLTALVPFLILVFELPILVKHYGSSMMPVTHYLMIWILGFSLFAFLLNLIREVIKDTEDFEGDHAYGKKTIPVIWGIKAARYVSLLLIMITVLLLASAWFWWVRDYITLAYFIIMLVLPLLLVSRLVMKSSDAGDWHKASRWLKIIMLNGLGYMIVVNLIINFKT